MHLSFQKLFYIIATLVGLFAILILAKTVLIPIAFAFLVACILLPVARKFESWGINEIAAALLSVFALLITIAGSIVLFSNQIIRLSKNLSEFKEKILEVFASATIYLNANIGLLPELEQGEILEKLNIWVSESGGLLLTQTFSGTAGLIVGLLTAIVFTFLILIYRNGLVRALVSFYPVQNRVKAFNMFKSIQQVAKQYLFGMMVIILVLGLVNSIGLWIIGIDSPFLFGFLAGILTLIPYAGTLLGAAITILYAFVSYDSIWMPITIAIFFWFVQFIESNFLSPKIVGGNLKLNAITSILSIIIGATVWGVAGMILFLPFVAMFKVVCLEYEELKPVALLIGEHNSEDETGDQLYKGWITKLKSRFV
jgi:predicted PurR-regulated permease PerM